MFRFFTTDRNVYRTAAVILFATLLLALAAFSWRRALQIWGLTFPFVLLLLLRIPDGKPRFAAKALAWIGLTVSFLDIGVRGYLLHTYETDPGSSYVLESVANTTSSEGLEFLQNDWGGILLWTVPVVFLILLSLRLIAKLRAGERQVSRWAAGTLVVFLVIVSAVAYSVRPWRRFSPILYWPGWAADVEEVKANWAKTLTSRDALLARGQALLTKADAGPRTIVWVIGESVNPKAWSLYGYELDTTPELRGLSQTLTPPLEVFENAWAVSSSTVASFEDMFTFAATEKGPKENLLLPLFRAAGYRITWISNQEDVAIRQQFASLADRSLFLNKLGGRSSVSLDEKVIGPLREALADPAPKHLVIVHLIGAHPHYRLRAPEDYPEVWTPDNPVEQRLEEKGRSFLTIETREDYDRTMRYHDHILAETLKLTAARPGPVTWFYLSDHGQEIGDLADRTGHAANLPSGYRIPVLLWERPAADRKAASENFRTDWTAPLLLDLAGIEWKGEDPTDSIVDPSYHWETPENPVIRKAQGDAS